MRFSILYRSVPTEDHGNIIYDLSIDRSVANFSRERRKNEYFCSVLARPLNNREDICYRREILGDFMRHEGLLPALKTLFNRYDKLKSDWLELKGTGEYSREDKGSEAMLDYTYSSLKVTALFPKTIISFFKSVVDTLSSYDIASKGLCALRDHAGELLANSSLARISEIASLFMYNSPWDYDFELTMTQDDTLGVQYAMISGITKREKKKSSILSILSKKGKEEGIIENKSGIAGEDALDILGEALFVIDKLLEDITDNVYSDLYGLSAELDFYEVALKYTAFIEERKTEFCYPEFSCDSMELGGLKDLFLLTESEETVYPNDLVLRDVKGALIKGKNNTGKTTFLRSIATAQLFFQAGLPVTACSAALPVYSGVYTHFSGAEEEFSVGDSSGRFEGEVKAVADIMNRINKGSLVILNETFQTTSYDEGSQAMSHILSAIGKLECRYIFVTHLTELFDMMGDDTAKFMSADGGSPFTIKNIKEIRT